jgi:hypothetical protein
MAEVAGVISPVAEATPVATSTQEPAVDTAGEPAEAKAEAPKVFRFAGSPSNMVPGMGILLAAVMAFSMGMTDVFFAEAIAWTFVLWGLLLVYSGLQDINETYTVTDEGLEITNVMRPWGYYKKWEWAYINRMDLVVKRAGARPQDMEIRVYYMRPPDLSIHREDRLFDPELARLIVEYAGLRPTEDAPQEFTSVPTGRKATYTWTR